MPVQRTDGFLLEQTYSVSASVASTLTGDGRAGELYVNIHSESVPAGELRGQLSFVGDPLIADGDTPLAGGLSGDQEVPPAISAGTGQAEVTIGSLFVPPEVESIDVSVSLFVLGLGVEPARAMHIHSAPAGSNGGVVLNLDPGGALLDDTVPVLRDAGFELLTGWQGSGDDELIEGSGAIDLALGAGGNDTIKGAGNADRLSGGNGRDNLSGGGGADEIDGGNGKDKINGGKGNDMVAGSEGNDVIRTGDGRDIIAYRMSDPEGEGTDRIKDFSAKDGFAFVGSGDRTIFSKADADDPAASIKGRANAVVLTDTPLTLEEAQDFLEEQSGRTRDGVFAYFDSDLEQALLVYAEDLGDASAPTTVLARFGDQTVLDTLGAKDMQFVSEDDVTFI